jgi:hypothetical protein
MDGDLWLSMMWRSKKTFDLCRDPRILVHSRITGQDAGDGEFKVRGLAVASDDLATQSRYADEIDRSFGWRPKPGRFHLFAVNIEEISFIRYDADTGDRYVCTWPNGHEFVRRVTNATSMGKP